MDSGIIIESFKLLWKNKRFYSFVLLIQAVLYLIYFTFIYDFGNGQFKNSILFNIVFILTTYLLNWIIARFVYLKLNEQKFDFFDNVAIIGQRILRLITVSFINYIIVYLGFLLFIFPGIILSIMFLFASYGVLFENESIVDSLKNSVSLTKNHKLDIFFTMLLLGVMFIPVVILFYLIPGWITVIPFSTVASVIYVNIVVIWYYRLKQNYIFAADNSSIAEEDGYVEGEYKPFCPNCMKIYDDNIKKCPECGFYLERQF